MALFNLIDPSIDPGKDPGKSIDVYADMYTGLSEAERKMWEKRNANTARLYNFVYSPYRKQIFDARKFRGMDEGMTTYEGGLQMYQPFMKPPAIAAENEDRLKAIDAMGLYVDPQTGDLFPKKKR